MFAVWVVAVVLAGSALTSYHQPFLAPSEKILTLAGSSGAPGWRAIHVLSGGCGCSQKVMAHILGRKKFAGVAEQFLIIDGPEGYLPGSEELLSHLAQAGFPITHLAVDDLPQDAKLRGVPMLVIASPDGRVAYLGGYGSAGDQDSAILEQVRAGRRPKPIPIIGCAIGKSLRRSIDPFHMKY
jgi:hypothetical protein